MHRFDLTDLARISEAHFADVLGAAMHRFHDKYKNAGPEFFVNFNPVISDPRDKTIVGQQSDSRDKVIMGPNSTAQGRDHPTLYRQPDHHDPVGTYAYPAEYVANHWHDLQYGSDMGNLRVLKASPDPEKTLTLSNMTEDYFIQAMKRLNMEFNVRAFGWLHTRSKRDALMIYEAIFQEDAPNSPHVRINSYGKVLFKLIQHKYKFAVHEVKNPADSGDGDDFDEEDDLAEPPHSSAGTYVYQGPIMPYAWEPLSQQQQTKRLLAAGYEVVVDRAKSPLEATIYPDEPEQAIFLTKRSYEVVDVYKINGGSQGNQTVRPERQDQVKMTKKAGWLIAKSMNDSITDNVSRYFNRQVINEPSQIKNLNVLRHWIATERIEPQMMSSWDPTHEGAPDAWVTAKGNLIVLDPVVNTKGTVTDPTAKSNTRKASYTARIRPGEDQVAIESALNDHIASESSKMEHRKFGAHNTLSFNIGLVTSAAEPTFIKTEIKESLRDLPAKVQAALKQNSTPGPFRRITKQLLEQFIKDAKKKIALVKPVASSAVGASPGNPPTATPAAPGGTSAHPAP